MHTSSLAGYMERIYRGDWSGIGAPMLASAQKLSAIAAEFLIRPDNTIHQALPHSPLPWLHIAGEVAAEAERRGFRRLALTAHHCSASGASAERRPRRRLPSGGDGAFMGPKPRTDAGSPGSDHVRRHRDALPGRT